MSQQVLDCKLLAKISNPRKIRMWIFFYLKKIRRGQKLEECVFASFGNSSEIDGYQFIKKNGAKRENTNNNISVH